MNGRRTYGFTTFALLLPYLPGLFARLRGKQPQAGRLVFGEGKED